MNPSLNPPLKILLFGKDGQLGWELQRSLAPLGEVIALGARGEAWPTDFNDPESLVEAVRAVRPDAVVNAAAFTAVDRAESDTQAAHRINALAPGVLAREARGCGALMVHYSSDYVFDGSGQRPWREADPTGPLNAYGHSKLAGEMAVRAQSPHHLVLRTSWVHSPRGANFARTLLRLAQERDAIQVVDDQFGAPTGADLIADVTAHALRQALADRRLCGTYHLAAAGETSWHGYASFLLERAQAAGWPLRCAPGQVQAIAASAYPAAAQRPANSRLDTARLRQAFGVHLPHWRQGVERMLFEMNRIDANPKV